MHHVDILLTEKFFTQPKANEAEFTLFPLPDNSFKDKDMQEFLKTDAGQQFKFGVLSLVLELTNWCNSNNVQVNTTIIEIFLNYFNDEIALGNSSYDLYRRGIPILTRIIDLIKKDTSNLEHKRKIIFNLVNEQLGVCPPGVYDYLNTAEIKLSPDIGTILLGIRKEIACQIILQTILTKYKNKFIYHAGNNPHYIIILLNEFGEELGIPMMEDKEALTLMQDPFWDSTNPIYVNAYEKIAQAMTVENIVAMILTTLDFQLLINNLEEANKTKNHSAALEAVKTFELQLDKYGYDSAWNAFLLIDSDAMNEGVYKIVTDIYDQIIISLLHRLANSQFIKSDKLFQIVQVNKDTLFYIPNHSLKFSYVVNEEKKQPLLSYAICQYLDGNKTILGFIIANSKLFNTNARKAIYIKFVLEILENKLNEDSSFLKKDEILLRGLITDWSNALDKSLSSDPNVDTRDELIELISKLRNEEKANLLLANIFIKYIKDNKFTMPQLSNLLVLLPEDKRLEWLINQVDIKYLSQQIYFAVSFNNNVSNLVELLAKIPLDQRLQFLKILAKDFDKNLTTGNYIEEVYKNSILNDVGKTFDLLHVENINEFMKLWNGYTYLRNVAYNDPGLVSVIFSIFPKSMHHGLIQELGVIYIKNMKDVNDFIRLLNELEITIRWYYIDEVCGKYLLALMEDFLKINPTCIFDILDKLNNSDQVKFTEKLMKENPDVIEQIYREHFYVSLKYIAQTKRLDFLLQNNLIETIKSNFAHSWPHFAESLNLFTNAEINKLIALVDTETLIKQHNIPFFNFFENLHPDCVDAVINSFSFDFIKNEAHNNFELIIPILYAYTKEERLNILKRFDLSSCDHLFNMEIETFVDILDSLSPPHSLEFLNSLPEDFLNTYIGKDINLFFATIIKKDAPFWLEHLKLSYPSIIKNVDVILQIFVHLDSLNRLTLLNKIGMAHLVTLVTTPQELHSLTSKLDSQAQAKFIKHFAKAHSSVDQLNKYADDYALHLTLITAFNKPKRSANMFPEPMEIEKDDSQRQQNKRPAEAKTENYKWQKRPKGN